MRDVAAGIRYLAQGQRWVFTHRRWLAIGLVPALIALVLYAAALVLLALYAGDIASWATPFADDWDETWRSLLRTTFALLLFAFGLLLAVITFTAVTLLIGDPFYEALAEAVERTEGGGPASPGRPLWAELWTSLRDSVQVLLRVLAFTVPLFVLGFVPLLGQTVVPALGFAVSGFFLTVELSSVAMTRRGIPVSERMRLLRGRLGLALGFGVPLVLLFLLPLVAVVLMPGAVAGATLLARDLAGRPLPVE
ncbi:EI24 domain-containing protein [Streptomyces litchfieldiae]|uniref:EI24 domain-containing protein n=1 Tax=Streptomyces litchfieldiae TaxID=3075543 RepID=A0ABU2MV95_9ACTN|nr:EI24 domain-containing protein [Streptomyces sp. DSM 44938]MDT0344768.1 EI24 domain-containing protein [Streptomyces sp. DSM 44938]